MLVKKVYKYGTGDIIPNGAVYLKTVVQNFIVGQNPFDKIPCWLVWHYFLVEVEE